MSTKFNAVVEAVENANTWMGGAVVVRDSDSFEAIPQAYLGDISYTGSRDVVIDLTPDLESATGYSLDGATAEDIAAELLV